MCVASADGSLVATGNEQGQLNLYDTRYFGPPLHSVHLLSHSDFDIGVIPLPVSTTINPSSNYTNTRTMKDGHAIQALSMGFSEAGMPHTLAFQLRGGCRVGFHNLLTNATSLLPYFSSTSHPLPHCRIALSKTEPILFYGDGEEALHAIFTNSPYHTQNLATKGAVTCVDTHALGVVVGGLDSGGVVLFKNDWIEKEQQPDLIVVE